jgi:ribonuclease HI
MYFDGSLNLEGAGAGVLFISPQGDHLKYALQIQYKVSNNSTEYETLIYGLPIVVSSKSSDSLLTATLRSSSTKSTRHAMSRMR